MYGWHLERMPVTAVALEELSITYLALGMHQYGHSYTGFAYGCVLLGIGKTQKMAPQGH
jgi:hypothetical protein